MKKVMIAFVALFSVVSAFAQDIITKKDGTDIQAKITEVNSDDIKYKRFDNLDGPTYTISKTELLMIIYADGSREIISSTPAPSNPQTSSWQAVTQTFRENQQEIFASDPSRIVEGMKYRNLKKMYDRRDYDKLSRVKYPAAMSWSNLLVPGLAQYIMGEGGLGTLYLVPGLVNYGLITAGSLLAGSEPGLGAILAGVGGVGSIVVTVTSIVNASRVAKVKSLYNDDLRSLGLSYEYSLDLHPYVAPIYDGSRYVAAAGMSLTFKF